MTKEQAKIELEQVDKRKIELQAIIDAPDKPLPEERLWQMFNGCVIYIEPENPNSVFWMKDGEWWFELENDTLWCRNTTVWSIFEKEYSLQYEAIQSLIKSLVEQRYKMKGITPESK